MKYVTDYFKGFSMNKGLMIITIIFFVLMVLDFWSTMRLGRLAYHLESNPIFLQVRSFAFLILLNLFFIFLATFFYFRSGVKSRFFIINYLLWGMVMRCFAIVHALKVKANPPSLEVAQSITESVKQTHYLSMALQFVIPFVIGFVAFLFFKLDHIVRKKEGNIVCEVGE